MQITYATISVKDVASFPYFCLNQPTTTLEIFKHLPVPELYLTVVNS